MSKSLRQLISTGGALNGTGWSYGHRIGFAAATVTSATETIAQIVVPPTADAADQPLSTTPIQRLYGGSIALAAALTAQSTLRIAIAVRRAGATLGSADLYGWEFTAAGTPAFTAWVPVAMPDLHASNTALVQDGGAGPYFVPLLANDVITLLFQSSGSVAAPAGSVQLDVF